VAEEAVDHHVTDHLHALAGNPFAAEVIDRIGRGGEQDVRELIGDDAVDLLGHRAIERAEARLHVREPDPALGRDQRGGDRRVHVTDRQDQVRSLAATDLLEGHHHPGDLLGVGRRAHAEAPVGLGQPEIVGERAAQAVVVVLAGVHENAAHGGESGAGGVPERRHLHVVRAGPHDERDRGHPRFPSAQRINSTSARTLQRAID
jgi:hypothetical protein